MVAPHDNTEPRSVNEALCSPNIKEWMYAMKDEIESTRTNQVQDLVGLPVGARLLGTNGFLRSSRRRMGLLRV